MTPPVPSSALTRAEAREVDRLAIEELGIPGVVLMENAGRGAAEIALELLADAPASPSVLVVCGAGNNGGDGWVVARHLDLARVPVVVATLQPGERERSGRQAASGRPPREASLSATGAALGDAAVMRRIVERMGLAIVSIATAGELALARDRFGDVSLVVDALLGTGFRGGLREEVALAIDWIGDLALAGARVLALDVPSGLDCDTGRPSTPTVRATRTATFVAPKAGFGAPAARPFLGRVDVVSIGAPRELVERVRRAGGAESPHDEGGGVS